MAAMGKVVQAMLARCLGADALADEAVAAWAWVWGFLTRCPARRPARGPRA